MQTLVAHPDTLVVGSDYFLVHYFDEDLLVPCIMTLRYEGPETADSGERLWLFRDLDAAEDSADSDPKPSRIGLDDSQIWEVLDLDGLLAVLNELRSVRPPTTSHRAGLGAQAVLKKHLLHEEIDKFLKSPDHDRFDVTIRFRDKGLFLKKVAETVELHVFTHPLRAAAEDERLGTVMRERNIPATTDYLADAGRTRVLHYVLPRDPEFVAQTCAAILADAYAFSADDELDVT